MQWYEVNVYQLPEESEQSMQAVRVNQMSVNVYKTKVTYDNIQRSSGANFSEQINGDKTRCPTHLSILKRAIDYHSHWSLEQAHT